MKDLISIIIPIYRVESYLRECIDSVIHQTYSNLEIILVDDGSDDNCPKICDEYQLKDQRIKVIHKENGGIASARNTGLENVTGKYILFVDPDDYVDSKLVETLYNNLKKNDADISICNFYYQYPDNLKSKDFPKNNFTVTGIEKFNYLYDYDYNVVSIVCWCKLFKREVFDQIRYPMGMIHEDEEVIFDLFYKAKVISYCNDKLYYYRQHEKSIMHKFNLKRLDAITVRENRIKKIEQGQLGDNLLKKEYFTYLYLLEETTILGLKSIGEEELCKKYCQKARELTYEIRSRFSLNLKEKLKIQLITLSPFLFAKLTQKRNEGRR